MKLDLSGLGICVTEGIQEYVEKRVEKLDKFFDDSTIVHVTFSAKKDRQNVDMRIEYKGKTYLAEEETEDVYSAIDNLIDKVLGQVRKQKTKILKNRNSEI